MSDDPTTGAMPAVFIGHGSPMNTLEHNAYTETWADVGERVGRPRAILCVSAHWYVNITAVTAMAAPPVIHDFYGFPDELFAFDYPAPGSPELAEEVADVLSPSYVGLDRDSWGLDHGTWSVLAHMYPAADVPVVQLSINGTEPLEVHLELGRRLAGLRDRGVLVVGSGNVVHNLRRLDPRLPDDGTEWARSFDLAAREVLTERPGDLVELERHPDYALAVPTPDHFLPVAYLAGMADAAGVGLDLLVGGYQLGSLSMASYGLGCHPDGAVPDDVHVDESLPDPSVVPPDATNL
ncbi:4,5-DOPA dioxygenase extradiol [Dermatobacter hominis]|uniref:4,5-DOPA-extradiol-dioxygenase n=1 Tax=Dermatobacter hominis TaxID=2884263 RepID=UPI001D10DFAD|nr:4,5-DOPA dioxygenase extradiol [Dermatobacter hominis]UDY35893.1 4,5-DOPA dioxygenase extradiol [Dermatobacter hominis]